MTAFWTDDHLTLYGGDCRAVLKELPAESVHCVVTSPPYWGLRDYGTATWDGGDPECDHRIGRTMGGANKGAVREVLDGDRMTCSCGARRIDSQLGLEATPEEFVAHMVGVFREVRRVLRKDGTLWLNLGDSYAASTVGAEARTRDGFNERYGRAVGEGKQAETAKLHGAIDRTGHGLKPKDLVGIPWRVAFALQADGWYLRSDIIWAKPNPMPESVTDRPTKAHEYLFLLSKSPRYYFDAEAVREADSGLPSGNGFNGRQGGERQTAISGGNGTEERFAPGSGRNLRSVWTIATEPYPGAHFATFPRKLVEPCVKAGSPEGGTVLDPFAGSGTTLLVAQSLGRRGVGIDLSPDYLKQALLRNRQTPLGLIG